MKKMWRAAAAVLCVAALLGSAGCGKKSQTTTTDENMKLTHKLSDEPVTMTLFARQKEGYETNNVFEEAYRMTNVKLVPTLSQNVTDMDQALALAVAAKNIPDVIYDWRRVNFTKYGMQGALISLNDLMKDNAPNLNKYYEEHPTMKSFATAGNGSVYFIPCGQAGSTSVGWCIRQDWLDRVAKSAPETVDEFYEVMKAFRDGDPNGNGQADEVAYFDRQNTIEPLLWLFNSGSDFHYENGKAVFCPMENDFKTAMKEVKKWYDEKLIDPEVFTRKDARTYFCSNNLGGITNNWFGSTLNTNNQYGESVPGYKMVAMAPPANTKGVRRVFDRRAETTGEGWAISSMNKNPELTMKYFDFWWSEDGIRLANFGIEGQDYDMVDGKEVVKESVLKNKEVAANTYNAYMRHSVNFGFPQDFGYESQWVLPEALDAMNLYEEQHYIPELFEKPMMAYSDDQEERKANLKTQIDTYVSETIQSWILVGGDIDAEFETFKNRMKELGIEEYIAIEQDAYTKYLSVLGK